MKYKKIKLSNGAILYYTKNKINTITSIDFNFDCGSRCDTIPGLAHFCEHSFFTGTKTLNKEQISKKYFDFIGVNAYTSKNSIAFGGDVLTNELVDYIDTVAMMIIESEFKPKEIEKEKKVVIQEIARAKDDYWRKANTFNMYNLCNEEFILSDVLGSEDDINRIKRKDVVDYIHKYFVANNLDVFCCSPLGAGTIARLVEKHLINRLPKNTEFTRLPLYSDYISKDSFVNSKTQKIDKSYVNVNFINNIPNTDDSYMDRLELLMMLINDYTTGVLKKLRIDNSLVYGGGFNFYSNDKETRIMFRTECDAKNVNEVVTKLSEYLKEVFEKGFSEEQLKDQKHKLDYSKKSITPSYKYELGKLYDLKFIGKVRRGKKRLKRLKNLTLNDMVDTLHQSFVKGRVSMSVYGDMKKSELISKKEFDKLFSMLG